MNPEDNCYIIVITLTHAMINWTLETFHVSLNSICKRFFSSSFNDWLSTFIFCKNLNQLDQIDERMVSCISLNRFWIATIPSGWKIPRLKNRERQFKIQC